MASDAARSSRTPSLERDCRLRSLAIFIPLCLLLYSLVRTKEDNGCCPLGPRVECGTLPRMSPRPRQSAFLLICCTSRCSALGMAESLSFVPGFSGIGRDACLAEGCCWVPQSEGPQGFSLPSCIHPNTGPSSYAISSSHKTGDSRINCHALTAQSCRGQILLWRANPEGSPQLQHATMMATP